MSKREKCRKCGATLKHDKTSSQYDPEYCSGLCRKNDGSEPYVKTAEEQAAVVQIAKKAAPASYKDYQKNVGGKYSRRYQPEKLNWSANKMSESELEQAGFRANREPIPGDWDYQKQEVTVVEIDNIDEPQDWNAIRAQAKDLGIATHGKKRDEIEAEIKEASNG